MNKSVDISTFLEAPGLFIDVRSPMEYRHGHIPGAESLPLFDDSERAIIGTIYKQQSQKLAVQKGLEIVGPKLVHFVTKAESMTSSLEAKVYCARGGMRSSSMAWLLQTAGFKTLTLKGGYKAFRSWVLKSFSTKKNIRLIGGMTGSGKTEVLHALKKSGEQVLDLESLAAHRGSAYGKVALPALTPSTEQFENLIAKEWHLFDATKPIWIEDESRMIGTCRIPHELFLQMRASPLYVIEKPFEERVQLLNNQYGTLNKQELINSTARLTKRLGGLKTKEIIDNIESDHIEAAIQKVLKYYDSTYLYGLSKRHQPITRHPKEGLTPEQWAEYLKGAP